MPYPLTTLGGLGDATPAVVPAQVEAPSVFSRPSVMLVAGVAVGLVAGYLQWGRRKRR